MISEVHCTNSNVFISTGNAQQCAKEILIGGNFSSGSAAVVNTTIVPTCFTCPTSSTPANMPIFAISLDLIPLNSDVTQTAHQLIVTDFTGFPLLQDGVNNQFRCFDTAAAGTLYARSVTTLSK